MSIYNEIKKALSSAVDVVVDKTTTQAQKSRLVTVMKNEEKIANQAYVELGKYLYRNLREEMPEDVKELCVKIDESKERMSRAQQIYREVIQQELVNREINKTEAKESFQKIKEPIVSKAKDTAVKVKESVRDTAKDTAVKVSELKEAAVEKAEEFKNKTHQPENEECEVIIPTDHDINTDEIVEPIMPVEDHGSVDEVLIVGQGLNNHVDVISDEGFSDGGVSAEQAEPLSENLTVPTAETNDDEKLISSEAEDEMLGESFVPNNDVIDQEFQRNVPVDIITENDFEEDELEIKSTGKKNSFSKAMKLKNIITKKNNEE